MIHHIKMGSIGFVSTCFVLREFRYFNHFFAFEGRKSLPSFVLLLFLLIYRPFVSDKKKKKETAAKLRNWNIVVFAFAAYIHTFLCRISKMFSLLFQPKEKREKNRRRVLYFISMHHKLSNNRASNNTSMAGLPHNCTICLFPLHIRKIEIVPTDASFRTGIRYVHHCVIVSTSI